LSSSAISARALKFFTTLLSHRTCPVGGVGSTTSSQGASLCRRSEQQPTMAVSGLTGIRLKIRLEYDRSDIETILQVTGSFCDIPSLLRNRASCPFLCLRQQVPKARYFDDHIDVLPNAWYQLIHRPAMRGRSPLEGAARGFRQLTRHQVGGQRRRAIQISATPTTESPVLSGDELSSAIDASTGAAGRFRSPACRKDIF
jgi:hypothetical protein